MPRKPMTPAEALVGRRLPKDPTYLDQLMARFVKEDGETCARSEPSESHMRPAFLRAKRNGWLRLQTRMRIMNGRPFGIYQLTERGRPVALEARAKVDRIRAERQAWSRDFIAARKAAVARRDAEARAAETADASLPEEGLEQ